MSPISIRYDLLGQDKIFQTINQSITYSLTFETPCTNPRMRLTYCPKLPSTCCLFGRSREKAMWCLSMAFSNWILASWLHPALIINCTTLSYYIRLWFCNDIIWRRRRYNSNICIVNFRLSHFRTPLSRWMPHLIEQFTFVGYDAHT